MQIGNVGSASIVAQAVATQQQIDIALLAKTQEVADTQAQAAIALIEGVAEATAQHQSTDGQQLDVTA